MREIRLSGSMSGDGKRGRLNGLPRQSSTLLGVPKGIRTPVTAVKGRCPRPLDDGDWQIVRQRRGAQPSDGYAIERRQEVTRHRLNGQRERSRGSTGRVGPRASSTALRRHRTPSSTHHVGRDTNAPCFIAFVRAVRHFVPRRRGGCRPPATCCFLLSKRLFIVAVGRYSDALHEANPLRGGDAKPPVSRLMGQR